MSRCTVCRAKLVRVDRQGTPAQDGGYLACPNAILEEHPKNFERPWTPRAHEGAKLYETKATRDARIAAAHMATLSLFEGV